MKGSNVMGLITEEVEIMIISSNVEYWENKGYDIPRYYNTTYKKWCFKNGTKIHVRTSDLPKYSKAMVLVKYDCCGIEKIIRYEQYAQRNRDGKMYCSHCFSTLLLSGENNPKWRQDYSDDDRIERRYINGYYDFIKKINSVRHGHIDRVKNTTSFDVHSAEMLNVELHADEVEKLLGKGE